MADTKTPTPEKPSDFEYVTIPERDIFEQPYPDIWINKDKYSPGKHLVPAVVAGELRRIMKGYDIQQLRLYQPRRDMQALRDLKVSRGTDYTEEK